MAAVFFSSLCIHHYMYVFMFEPLIGVVFSSVTCSLAVMSGHIRILVLFLDAGHYCCLFRMFVKRGEKKRKRN